MDGRGRYLRLGQKTTTDELLRLDMARFAKEVDLSRLEYGGWNWLFSSGRKSSITYSVKPGVGVKLAYTISGDSLEYIVRTTSTSCTYGGVRYWWLCPSCHRRCRVLYCNQYFVCHRCSGAYYETQKNKDLLTRIDNELTAIRRKLKADKTLATTAKLPPPKPKGMHWRTYMRLGRRYNDLQYYRVLSISIDIAKMGEAMGIRIAGSAEDMAYQLKWLMDNER